MGGLPAAGERGCHEGLRESLESSEGERRGARGGQAGETGRARCPSGQVGAG